MDNSPSSPKGPVHSTASPSQSSSQIRAPRSDTAEFIVSTPEIQRWMASIEQHLNEVCSIATDGKLNSEQKMKISNLCRKIGSGTSQMAVLYQSLKQKTIYAEQELNILYEQRSLSDHISDLKQSMLQSTNSSTGNTSFADMVKRGTKDFLRPNNLTSIAIYPNDTLKTSDETKELVQKIIRPEQMKLHVRGVRKIKNGGVIISTETKQDADKLKNAVQLSTSGLTADEANKRKPRIVIVGVPNSMTENEVFSCIYEQNIVDTLPDLQMESFLAETKLSHKSGKKDAATCNYIIEVSANIRKALIVRSRVFINWSSCPVRDFTLVTRCYKCQQYGHVAKTCRDVNSTCGHCAETGHMMSECAKKSENPKCATCSRFKKPSAHKTGDSECPARKIAEHRFINSIDYEST